MQSDTAADVAVVGAGIAGVMTSYFLLKYTDKKVTLLEGAKVAHGATGHNAGQIVTEFEKSFSDLIRDFGLEKAIDAEKSVRSAWILLEEIYQDAVLETPLSSFMGYNGFRSTDHVSDEIASNRIRKEAGLQVYPIYITEDIATDPRILRESRDLYEVVPKENILSLLETNDDSYIAATATKKGCVNSALLVEEIVGYLLSHYQGRFSLFEHSSVQIAEFYKDHAKLKVVTNMRDTEHKTYKVTANRVILCTNGFERIHLKNMAGEDIDVAFHHMVEGNVGYMSAYLEPMKTPPTALGYFDQEGSKKVYGTDDYFYLTRRPYEVENNELHNLICIGGPQMAIPETQSYDRRAPFVEEKGKEIDAFMAKTIKSEEKKVLDYKYQWHGVMCYTPSGMRVLGPEPKNPVLMYNLGCNGVGIMTSIYGGSKIAKMINGEEFPPSAFDPKA
jgi:glycine/D-amino acid oxidase-like deaminating enzyme